MEKIMSEVYGKLRSNIVTAMKGKQSFKLKSYA
jgi:hypothetical protein